MPYANVAPTVRPPWFRRWPRATIAAAALLYVGVFVVRLSIHGASEVISLLYALPVALIAVAFGLAGGLLAGLVAVAGVLTWVIADSVHLTVLGWITRVVPLLLLGLLLGDAADRLQKSEDEKRGLAMAAQRQREAAELNDTIVQGLAAAKWSLEAGQHERGLEIVSETLATAQEHVSRLLKAADDASGGAHARRVMFDWHRAAPSEPAAYDETAT